MSGNGHQEISAEKNLYRIGEVSRITDTKPFVLRYWETESPRCNRSRVPRGIACIGEKTSTPCY